AINRPLPNIFFDQPEFSPRPTVPVRPSPPGPALAVTPAPPAVDPRIVEFLFASIRKQNVLSPTQSISYTGERGLLTFGAASVRIPDDHKIGRIELPSSWRLFGLTLSSSANER